MKTRERTLRLKIARSWMDFEHVREIRNQCKGTMTNDKRKIHIHQQFWFWLHKSLIDKDTVIWLGFNECDKPIAFGVLKYDEHLRPWLTGGLLKAYRGLGYGRQLFQAMCASFYEPVYLEVLCDNIPAVCLYQSLGFKEISREMRGFEEVILMKMDCKNGSSYL